MSELQQIEPLVIVPKNSEINVFYKSNEKRFDSFKQFYWFSFIFFFMMFTWWIGVGRIKV